jgi:hypothetical protein
MFAERIVPLKANRDHDENGRLMTRDERARKNVLKDAAYWQKFARAMGWRVYAFTERYSASFDTVGSDPRSINPVRILGAQRDEIMKTLKKHYNRGKIAERARVMKIVEEWKKGL